MKTISVNKLADLIGGTIVEVELASLIDQHHPKKYKIGLGGVLNISYEPFESKGCSREGLPISQQAVTAVAREINSVNTSAKQEARDMKLREFVKEQITFLENHIGKTDEILLKGELVCWKKALLLVGEGKA